MEVLCCPICGEVPDIVQDDAGLKVGAYVAFCEACERQALMRSNRPRSSVITPNGRGMSAERALEMWNVLVRKANS